MKHWYQPPRENMAAYVRTILVLEGSGEPAVDALPLFTSGSQALVCHTATDNTGNQTIIQLSLCGRQAPAATWATSTNSTIIAYFFKPFAMATLFDIAAKELAENTIELSQHDAHTTHALKTQLVYADTIAVRLEALNNLLEYQLQQHGRECAMIQYATDYLMCYPGTESLATVLQELNLTERTFQRLFKKYVGVTANQYRRICQFQLTFAQVKGKHFDKLADVAYDNGFADQSHFIRTFKEFTETTPNDYLKKGLNGEK
ncbi:MAG: helix-turn-helix domain-containing protein [Chitinophagaceae bacterium]